MLFIAGAPVAQASGRLAGFVYATGIGGPYVRNGTFPTTVTSAAAIAAKARMSAVSQQWRTLTDAQRLAWTDWAQTHPVQGRLGRTNILSGAMAYNMNNATRMSIPAPVSADPPIADAPPPLLTLVQSCDIGAGAFEVAFSATPTGAAERLRIWACKVSSPGIKYVQNLMRLIGHSGAAEASPFDHQTLVEDRFGACQVGETVHVAVEVVSTDTGLVAARLIDSTEVVTT